MRIAVNTRYLSTEYLEGYGNFIFEIFKRLAQKHPEHEFIFLFDRPYDQRFITEKNITPVVTGPPARHPLLWKLWYDVKVPAQLKKYKADVFVSCDGFCSLTTSTPQCLVVHDLAFLHYPLSIKKSHLFFYKRYTPKFLKKANSIATVSLFSKNDIVKSYGIDEQKIDVVYNGVKDGFTQVNEEQKQATRAQYTDGKQFFIYTGSIHPRKNLINLLKAFSIFKKRQQTDWKLVLAGRLAWKYDRFSESLKSYKYRQDVVMTGYINDEQLANLTSAAYAMVYPSLWEGFGVPVIEAMKCHTPVITTTGTAMEEIAGDAALYADASNHKDIADKMMLLYKDESLRSKLIERGAQVAAQYNWEQTAELLWHCILKAAGQK